VRVYLILLATLCLCIRCTQIKTHAWSNSSVTLVGNKCDLEDARVILTKDGEELAQNLGNTNNTYLLPLNLLLLNP